MDLNFEVSRMRVSNAVRSNNTEKLTEYQGELNKYVYQEKIATAVSVVFCTMVAIFTVWAMSKVIKSDFWRQTDSAFLKKFIKLEIGFTFMLSTAGAIFFGMSLAGMPPFNNDTLNRYRGLLEKVNKCIKN